MSTGSCDWLVNRRLCRSWIPEMLPSASAVSFCGSRFHPVAQCIPFKPSKVSNFTTRVFLPQRNADHRNELYNAIFSARSADCRRLNIRRKLNSISTSATGGGDSSVSELDDNARRLLCALLWIAECVYIIWLFLLPYAPGDPVWAISSETINSIIGLSLNFFFILPLCNSVGIHVMEAPVLHPVSEGLFNFVIGWTVLFGPLLYTDKWRDKFKGALDILWGCQLFLTNTFLIPYMAIRLNEANGEYPPQKTSQLGSIMTKDATGFGLIGGLSCLVSIAWAIYGRGDANFGDVGERWEFLLSYVRTERIAYAFIWDICLYLIFQPWLIGDNLQNIQKDKVGVVNFLKFVPVVGIVAYCLFLDVENEGL